MASITLTDVVAHTLADAGVINSNNASLRTAINGGLDNANVAANAAIAVSKLALPGGTTNFLRADGQWAAPPGGAGSGPTVYTKITQQDVTSATKTDLLNNEITIAANAMTANGAVKIWAGGDVQSTAARSITIELKLGATVLWDSGASANLINLVNRHAWFFEAVIQALGSQTSQLSAGAFLVGGAVTAATAGTGFIDTTTGTVDMYPVPFMSAASSVAMTSAQTLTLSVTNSGTSVSTRLRWARIEVT
jgi:hypothetical protein